MVVAALIGRSLSLHPQRIVIAQPRVARNEPPWEVAIKSRYIRSPFTVVSGRMATLVIAPFSFRKNVFG
jgi:hypothetical protein